MYISFLAMQIKRHLRAGAMTSTVEPIPMEYTIKTFYRKCIENFERKNFEKNSLLHTCKY